MSLNQYSCLLCRKRKKKCDRVYPCQNCCRVGTECTFTPRRASARHKAPVNPMERLRHLEDVIGRLKADLEIRPSHILAKDEESASRLAEEVRSDTGRANATNQVRNCVEEVSHLQTELGRLAIGEGRSRYVVGSFWASLDEQVWQHRSDSD
jgi:hypothetical protein